MPTLTINGTPVSVPAGILLGDAFPPDLALEMPCGGLGRCGKCRVTAQGALSAPTDEELHLLTRAELALHTRLACHTRVLGDVWMRVTLPAGHRIQDDGVEAESSSKPLFLHYGVAVDVGTTTLAARLYGAEGLLARASAPNPQCRYGADVISRLGRARTDGAALSGCIRTALSALLCQMAEDARLQPEQVDSLVITGNTAMLYLLVGRDPDCLVHAPFQADTHFDLTLSAETLGLPCPAATVYLPPCIAAFVGADITTALLAWGLCRREETALLVDIGTNGEMALWHRGALTCCSTAAGPTFEGAGLSMGMPGRAGAIDRVVAEPGGLVVHTIGEVPPVGICGSGVISAASALLITGQMDEGGGLSPTPAVIAPPVALTQKDVRMLQLAKSAVRSGIDTLLDWKELNCGAVSLLGIAGGFGSSLDVSAASAIGLIPPELAEKTQILGNAALVGAAMLLNNTDLLEEARALATGAEVLELSQNAAFSHYFVENMMF